MKPPETGPSSNAWGVQLSDPWVVSHQGKLVAFARAVKAPTDTLYFKVLDPSAAVNAADESAWNGWYRFQFALGLAVAPGNQRWADQQPPPQVRLAGMDLLTVTPVAEAPDPADASFQIFSDDRYLYCFRPSRQGTLYLTRLGLLSRVEEIAKQQVTRYALEDAWEVRYQRSGLRDVPYDTSDTQSALDLTGRPFLEPTLELSQIGGITDGGFAVARVPTGDPSRVAWYVATTTATGVRLFRFDEDELAVTNFTESTQPSIAITPTLAPGGAALKPIAGFAPALLFYAEHDGETAADGQAVELPRAGRLMLALAVSAGAGLESATAIYDFSVGKSGNVPILPAAQQSLLLVDGTFTGGVFTPDNASPSFPTPAQEGSTIHVVDGLTIDSMLLGQVQPHTTPVLRMGEDGLVHLYYGGPLATEADATGGWHALVPGVPKAMVAQLDPRVSRAVVSIPWREAVASEQPPGAVHFTARQSGAVMEGAKVAVSDVTFGADAQPDLCTVTVTYPAATGLPAETWIGVPREVAAFADVLNGEASRDTADPQVSAGNRPFFDFSGKLGLARVPVLPAGAPQPPAGGPYAPVLTFVSTRTSIALTGVVVSSAGAVKQVVLEFADAAGHKLSQTWAKLPSAVDSYADVFGGGASLADYDYVPGAGTTPLFALATDAFGIQAPLLLYPTGAGPDVSKLRIEVTPSSGQPGLLDVTFTGVGSPPPLTGVKPAVADFAAALAANAGFQGLGLAIDLEGVHGSVLPTEVVPTEKGIGAVDLRGAAAVFDLVLPEVDVSGYVATDKTYAAGRVKHEVTPSGNYDPTKLVGFVVTYDPPDAGASVYVTDKAAASDGCVNRKLAGRADEEMAQSGAWIRQTPHKACAFSGTDALTVPIVEQGVALPRSTNLRPQWNWTFESWLRPGGGTGERLVTFHDGVTPIPAYAPKLDYAVDLVGAKVLQFDSYAKQPGSPDSSFFMTGTHDGTTFLPAATFTWEVWVQPTATPAPSGNATPPLLGGVIQVQVPKEANAAFSIGLTADRHVILRVGSLDGSSTSDLKGVGIVGGPAADGTPDWTHLAVSATQEDAGTWTLLLYIDGVLDSTFSKVTLQVGDPRSRLIIGRDTLDDASMFGQLAQLRLWATARTQGEIRRTAFMSTSGSEAGLLGCWSLAGIETGGPSGRFLKNTATITAADWDAGINENHQPVSAPPDDVFLSVVASVAGLPPMEAQTLLFSGRWNHLALVFSAGGAITLNPPARLAVDDYDWMTVDAADALSVGSAFAIDTWVAMAAPPPLASTIASRWAWNEAPDEQSWMLQVDPSGNLVLTVKAFVDDEGKVEPQSVTSAGVNVADGKPHHVAASFLGSPAAAEGEVSHYVLKLFVDNKEVGTKRVTVTTTNVQVQASQAAFLVGRSYATPADAGRQPVESLSLFSGTLGRMRFWSKAPSIDDLFPERQGRPPAFGLPPGLVAEWDFVDQQGTIVNDSIGGSDGALTSSAPWSSLLETSTLTFYANGGVVGGVAPYSGKLPPSATSQFSLGAPVEGGIKGFGGQLAVASLWNEARSLETVQDQQFVPLTGDEQALLACWDFANGGIDITGGGNDANPQLDDKRIASSTVPVTNEGAEIVNAYGGVITELSLCSPGRIAVGSYVDVQQVGSEGPHAVLKRQYVFDPMASFGRAIQVGLLALIYIGQVQTRPELIGYIEGAPPLPSENLTRPHYLSGIAWPTYIGAASVSLLQQASDQVTYSSSVTNTGSLDVKGAIGVFGLNEETDFEIVFVNKKVLDFKQLAQVVFQANVAWGKTDAEQLSAEWTTDQRDQVQTTGDWEPYQSDQQKYLSPQAGRRFLPANLGYALVESLTADLYATVFKATGVAVGTVVIPNLGIPPDRNILTFPIDPTYTKAGTLDGKVGFSNDPNWSTADAHRGSYFRPEQAYSLATSIEQANARNQGYVAQFDWEGRGKRGQSGLEDPRAHLPMDFDQTPADKGQVGVPRTGIVNRYVWTSAGGLHAERQGFAAAATHSHTGFMQRTLAGGVHAAGSFYLFGIGSEFSLDVMGQHSLDVQVGVSDEDRETIGLDVSVVGEPFLRRWDPTAKADYGGVGAYAPGIAPGKVNAYRFLSFFLPPSTQSADMFGTIVDPVWKEFSNDPAARALRELSTPNPVWRVLHRVTYVERIPPPIASRPLYTVDSDLREPVNLPGNVELIRLIDKQLGVGTAPTPVNVGKAVAAVLNPPPTGPGVYPPSVLEGLVPWWRTFLTAARPHKDPKANDPAATALLAELVTEVTDYAIAGYQTGAIPRLLKPPGT